MSKKTKIYEDKQDEISLLIAKDLHKTYQQGRLKTRVLNGVSFTMQPKEMVAIVGNSGSGKSTLLHLLGGLDSPTQGDVIFEGKSLRHLSDKQKAQLRNKDFGFIYQFHHLLPDFTSLENIAMPLLIAGVPHQEAQKKAKAMLGSVQLSSRAHHRPSELSGGERQRVAIGRALINQPKIVMADEPTGNLDHRTANAIFDLLLELNRQHETAFLVVTHDLELAHRLDVQFDMIDGQLHPSGRV